MSVGASVGRVARGQVSLVVSKDHNQITSKVGWTEGQTLEHQLDNIEYIT